MAGVIIELFPKRNFDFRNGNATYVVTRNVRALAYTSGVLEVRVFTNSIASASTIDVVVMPMSPTDDQPNFDFEVTNHEVARFGMTSSTANKYAYQQEMSAPWGALLLCKVEGIKSGGNCEADISARLVMKV